MSVEIYVFLLEQGNLIFNLSVEKLDFIYPKQLSIEGHYHGA